jgi:hypothetical protein
MSNLAAHEGSLKAYAASDPACQEAVDVMLSNNVNSVVAELGLNPGVTKRAWETGYGQNLLPNGDPDPGEITAAQYQARCLSFALQLNQTHPGGVAELWRRNNILNFGWATSVDTLRTICDERSRSAARAILYCIAGYCPNGAMMEAFRMYEQLHAKPPADTAIIPIGVSCVNDLKLARPLLREHGKGLRADVTLLNGHGDHEGMDLRRVNLGKRGDRLSRFTILDLDYFVREVLAEVATPETTVGVPSCETAQGDNSFAEELNRRSGLRTIAPPETVCVQGIRVFARGDTLRPKLLLATRQANTKTNEWELTNTTTRLFRARPSAQPWPRS